MSGAGVIAGPVFLCPPGCCGKVENAVFLGLCGSVSDNLSLKARVFA